MNTPTKSILIAGALVAAVSTVSSQAADQSAFFTQQQEMSDGYYPQYTVPAEKPKMPETARQAREDAFLDKQLQITDGYYPQYKVYPTARQARPETLHQAQEDEWFARERALGSTSVKPVPFPVPHDAASASKALPVATAQVEDKQWDEERAESDGYTGSTQATAASAINDR